MKSITKNYIRNYLTVCLALFLSMISLVEMNAQTNCEVTKVHGQGYTTTIKSVTSNSSNQYTILLSLKHDNCGPPQCKKINHFAVQAIPGTYSNVSAVFVSGGSGNPIINLGPNIGGLPFQGFRITGLGNFGQGAGEMHITYTLTGNLQNQQTLVKAASNNLIVSFSIQDFQTVLNCAPPSNIVPYYPPPAGGKLESLIGPELTALYDIFIATGTATSNAICQVFGTSVLIEIFPLEGQYTALLNLLTSSYGLSDIIPDPDMNVIIGNIPIEVLLSLNNLTSYINYAVPVYLAIPTSGIVTSLGDVSMRSDFARNGFNLEGEGIKIGVLSDSYNTQLGDPAHDDVLKGDLPGLENPDNTNPVEILKEYPYGTRSDEGRAMLQIIHDIAPKANLAFRTGFINSTDFADGIRELEQAGCNLIVDDITYITQPFLKDGDVAQAVNEVKTLGVTYFSAAGNYGNKSYQSNFNTGITPPEISGIAHNFAGGGVNDIYQNVSLGEGNYTIVLQWDDGSAFESTATDLDIYLTNNNGVTLFGFNRNNIGGQPIEVLPFTVAAGGAQTNIMIVKSSGGNNVYLKYVVFRGDLTFNEYSTVGSTLVGQSNAEGAIAVGAVLYTNTPPFGVNPPTIASFSSVGGTPVNGVVRNKPEITAPNGVNTTVNLGGVNIDGDPFPNFFGTSAAAPHAAGVAALILNARSNFYNTGISPDGIKGILQSTAVDMNTPGFDYSTGHGFINAAAALSTMANPEPELSGLLYDTTVVPGEQSLAIEITGNYFTVGSEIYFDGLPLESGTTIVNGTTLSGIIPEFTGLYNPIQVYNPPFPGTNGTDGGLSNPLYFNTKETILITIDNKTKKYGEVLPEFTANYTLENINGNIALDSSNVFDHRIARIKNIGFETVANSLSNVGLWEIEPSANDPLNPESNVLPSDTVDIALLNQYNFVIVNGLLSIETMDLLIQPMDTTLVYGDTITGIEFDYVFNNDANIDISPEDTQAILSLLYQNHATALVNATALVKAKALVNAQGEPLLDATALVNKSFLISEATALANANSLVNGTMIDPQALLDATTLENESALVNGAALVKAKALVNGTALVNIYDANGNLVNAKALVNTTTLVNATALVNTTTINDLSNNETIVILGEGDIAILAGDSVGIINLRSVNLITGNDVGQHLIVPGGFLTNNFNVAYGLGTVTIIPALATISFNDESLTQIYDGNIKLPIVTTDPENLEVEYTFNGEPDFPVEAGIYEVFAAISDSNYTGSNLAIMTIQQANAIIYLDNLNHIYDGTIKSALFSTLPEELNVILSYSDVPLNAGSYEVTATIDDLNYSGSMTDYLIIEKVLATVTADLKVIKQGDPLPQFSATFTGFVIGENESVVSSLTFSLDPGYSGDPGSYAILPQAIATNYNFKTVSNNLYVNPYGDGAEQILLGLECVEQIPPDENGFTYVAHFSYQNSNATDIYIPIGASNLMIGFGGNFNAENQPEIFHAGGGLFDVPFDGVQIRWRVKSYNLYILEVATVTAKSTSLPCSLSFGSTKSAEVSTTPISINMVAYPNPTTDKVYIDVGEATVTDKNVSIYDLFGKVSPSGIINASGATLEIDFSAMEQGVYIIRLQLDNERKLFRIIKK